MTCIKATELRHIHAVLSCIGVRCTKRSTNTGDRQSSCCSKANNVHPMCRGWMGCPCRGCTSNERVLVADRKRRTGRGGNNTTTERLDSACALPSGVSANSGGGGLLFTSTIFLEAAAMNLRRTSTSTKAIFSKTGRIDSEQGSACGAREGGEQVPRKNFFSRDCIFHGTVKKTFFEGGVLLVAQTRRPQFSVRREQRSVGRRKTAMGDRSPKTRSCFVLIPSA